MASPGITILDEQSSIGDAHALTQLCRIAEDADLHPPAFVNMSFARLDSNTTPCTAGPDVSLRCEIEQLLDFLQQNHDTVILAAAGNHDKLLFPARAPGVLSVSPIDLTHFTTTGRATSWRHGPSNAQALFPGYDLFLLSPTRSDLWAPPPGASFATAFATG